MSSGSKFSRATHRGQSRLGPHQKPGIIPLRQGPSLKDRASVGLGKEASGSVCAGNGGITSSSQEETYQLLDTPTGRGRPFAMMIRLTPEILEELKQAEAEGNKPMMKFGANSNDHVIKVGPENFKFSSAPEPGDLCDIYERRSGEDGQDLLVEAGSVWRKLSVQRFLSASEKDRVKKRTAEAEKKQKLRKSILVDPSTQMMIPQAAPAEANGRKPIFKSKKEPPPKKRKVTMSPVTSAPKQRPQVIATSLIGNNRTASPASPFLEPPTAAGARGIPSSGMHPPKGRPAMAEGVVGPSANKGNATIQRDKAQPATTTVGIEGGCSVKMGSAVNMTDLRSFLITLLKENPKGVTIKAMEKAITEGMPGNFGKKVIEKVIKSIAYYCAPGKYLLNQGVEIDNLQDGTAASAGQLQRTFLARTKEEDSSALATRQIINEKGTCESSPEQLNVVSDEPPSQHSPVKGASTQPAVSELEDLNKNQANSPKQSAVNAKAASSEGSDSSSSSASGSDSDSDSGSESGSGSDSGSGSGSGSDSEASSSSSDSSMDEDVDIVSEDENEKKSDARHKPKVKEVKSVPSKHDSKVQEDWLATEVSESRPVDKSSTQEAPVRDSEYQGFGGAAEPLSTDVVPDNLIEKVFGLDEDTGVLMHANHTSSGFGSMPSEPQGTSLTRKNQVKGSSSSQDKTNITYHEEKVLPQKAQSNREQKGNNSFDQESTISEMQARAIKKGNQSDSLVEKIFEQKDETTMWINRRGSHTGQQEAHKPPMRSVELANSKGIDKQLMSSEVGGKSLLESVNREHSKSMTSDSGLSSKTLSLNLEVSKMQSVGSPLSMKHNVSKIGRLVVEDGDTRQAMVRQQLNMEMKRPFAKSVDNKEKSCNDADKHDMEGRASETVVKGKSPEDMVRLSNRVAKNPEATTRLIEEGRPLVRTADQSSKGTRLEQSATSGRDEDISAKEKVRERSRSKSTKTGESYVRHSSDTEAQQWQQQKGDSLHGGANKGYAKNFTRESEQLSGYDRDLLQATRPTKESTKPHRSSRQLDEYETNDFSERVGLMVEQAERPMRDVDGSKRGKDISARDGLKEPESAGRTPPNGVASSHLKKMETIHVDSGRPSYSGSTHNRNFVHETDKVSQDLELGEFRETPFNNEPHESRKSLSRTEDTRSKIAVEPTSKTLSKKGGIGSDMEKSQAIGRSKPELTKQSPVKFGNDPGRTLQDSRNGKRRPEDDETAETERPFKKKLAATQARQPQHNKQERIAAASAREEGIEKMRSSTIDAQDHATASSKNAVVTNNRKQATKESEDDRVAIVNKQKTGSTPVVGNDKHRDDSSGKKQTPQSSEVIGNDFFARYEKKEPELRGSINNFEQYKEYCREFNEKYPIYVRLNASLERDKEYFESLRKEIVRAKREDDKSKLGSIYEKVKKDYLQCRKRFKRMKQTFNLLHEELQVIKNRCKEYAKTVGYG